MTREPDSRQVVEELTDTVKQLAGRLCDIERNAIAREATLRDQLEDFRRDVERRALAVASAIGATAYQLGRQHERERVEGRQRRHRRSREDLDRDVAERWSDGQA